MDGKLRNMASVYLTTEDAVLCLYRTGGIATHTYIGSAGGHFEPEELSDARVCVLREMEEEIGLRESDIEDLKLRYVTLRLKNGEIRQNYYFFARLRQIQDLKSTEGELHWIKFEDILSLEMPHSAKPMMAHYLAEGRYTDKLYAGVTQQAKTVFVELREF